VLPPTPKLHQPRPTKIEDRCEDKKTLADATNKEVGVIELPFARLQKKYNIISSTLLQLANY
jgi:hypothetical protein